MAVDVNVDVDATLKAELPDTTLTTLLANTARALTVSDTASYVAAVNAANSSTAVLAASATFTGTYVDVLGYAQSSVTVFVRPNILISADASDAKGSLFIDLSDTGSGAGLIQIPYVVRVPGLFIPQTPIMVKQYMRVRYLNDGGAAAITALGLTETAGTPTLQTQFALTTLLQPRATKELLRTLDQELSGSDPATVTMAVAVGQVPDGGAGYAKAPLGGTKTITPATSLLAAGATYTSNVIDTEQHPTIRLTVASDVQSAEGGVMFEWSDTAAFTVTQRSMARTFSAGHTTRGRQIQQNTGPRYLRIKYTNGATIQTRFFLGLRLNPTPTVETVDLVSSARGQTSQQDVTVAAAPIAAVPLVGRRTLRLKNLSSSARPMFYGFTAGVSSTNGDELAGGESIDLDIDEFLLIYVMTTSTSGAGVRCAVTEIA